MRLRGTLLLLISLLLVGPPHAAGAGGPAAPVLLIHGYGGAPEAWEAAIPAFEQVGYRRGETLFAVRLPASGSHPLDLFRDASLVRLEIERIRRETGAGGVDLVGQSRGGLIARILAAGETSALVRRAVSIATPHEGVLSDEAIAAMLREAGIPPIVRAFLPIPAHLQAGSPALTTLSSREGRFADHRSPALAIGVTWQVGLPPVLNGHDGIVPLASQLAWPGAESRTFRLGPSAAVLAERADPLLFAWRNPHLESLTSREVLAAVTGFLLAPAAREPLPPCDCERWPDLADHWAAPQVTPYLPDRLPYTLTPDGQRRFEPDRPMTRAEFVYGLARMQGLSEHLQPTPFTDLTGEWSLGYVEAARAHGLVSGIAPDQFGPDRPLTRAEAAVLTARGLGLTPSPGPSRFVDLAGQGHWAEGLIEAAATRAIVQGDGHRFRPDDPVTMAEGAVILIRAFGAR